jgi:putative restriction endonuclease
MEPTHGDLDADIRVAAFARLRTLLHGAGGALPWSAISQGFTARGRRYLFATTAEGIFRPVGMSGALSIKTVVPKPKGRIWYHDQSSPDLSPGSDVFWYAFLPLIYFFGVAPALYEPLFPTFVVEWNPTRLSCGLSFAPSFGAENGPMLEQALKALRGNTLRVPDDPLAMPDRERIAVRFEQYRSGAA